MGFRRLRLSQSELTRRAKVRVETLNRIERAKATAGPKVMERLDAVLNELETKTADAGKSAKAR